ncbi:zinc finger protein [Macleaya cordata]|uniref:Zinc finger protein n=1 Tax=Macleaya cordata TaxID=56857 RepID=A0A200Q007_MACCD|nr:zinc finger protein [Macleaya cordata]
MDTRGDSRRPLRGYVRDSRRRKVVLDLDLNDTPPGENRAAALDESNQQGGGGTLPPPPPPPATIDLEATDDEVVISSPRSFAEARNKSRRNQEVTVLDGGSQAQARQEEAVTRLTLNSYNMRKRPPPNQTIINCDQYINLEGKSSAKRKNVMKPPEPPQTAPPPKEPTFSCPVCMGPLVEEMSTKCGHIFCKKCIKAAITAQSKCPTCRRKLAMKDTIRIYLPATN